MLKEEDKENLNFLYYSYYKLDSPKKLDSSNIPINIKKYLLLAYRITIKKVVRKI